VRVLSVCLAFNYAGTYNLQPITAYRPIDGISPLRGISRLLIERVPDYDSVIGDAFSQQAADTTQWAGITDVAPPISLQLLLQL